MQAEPAATLRGSGYECLVPYGLTKPQYPGELGRADWETARLGDFSLKMLIMLRFLDMGQIFQNGGPTSCVCPMSPG